MRKQTLINILVAISAVGSASAYANTDNYQNVFGFGLGYGSMTTKTEAQQAEDNDTVATELYYRRMLANNYGVELGYKNASEGFTSVFSPISEVQNVTYSGPRVSGYASYPLGAGFEVYGKAGLTYYTTDYTLVKNSTSRDVKDSSLGGEAAAGMAWHYGHIGFSLEYNYAKDSNIDSPMVIFGTNLRF
ncbi:outer membrane beta-barrel protein [Vibrio marisflavi]|uniref:Outer membrane protein beta-barrel domain-containing protein n=1 Tax=Vibrio marisflavi CECT 7928 TaxID=634439 RepID=A0ABN8E0B6_9VIBR|nr:outer membrane beta-barrel protein [Vibrio marisflavi]CAH0536817.1 hypothetical protein VMF7928_00707 [Vibrio marisflavi CECT 7928]